MTLIPTAEIAVHVNKGYFFDDEEKAKLAKGWPKNEHSKCAPAVHCSLLEALTSDWPCPAYIVGHQPTAAQRRLTKDILVKPEKLAKIGGAVRMHLMIADVDNHTLSPEHVDAWFEGEREKIDSLLAHHPGLIVFRSRGGYRILGALPKPFEIVDADTDAAWRIKTFEWVSYFERCFGIKVDPLHDFTRYQRLPHDTRTKGGQPEDLEIIGDVEHLGVWIPRLNAADQLAATERAKAPSGKATGKRPAPNQGAARDAGAPTLFRVMMRNRGLLGRYDSTGGFWTCVCPAEHEHSSPSDDPHGDDTVLYENDGKDWGGFNCLHTNCGHEGRKGDAKFWQQYFSKDEIAQAKKECGMASEKKQPAPSAFEEPVERTDVHENIPDLDAAIKNMAPPAVPSAEGCEIPKAPEFVCDISVIPVKDSKADTTIANLILTQAQRYVGEVIALKPDHDPETPLLAYRDGYYRQLPQHWLLDCIKQYEGSVTVGDKLRCKQKNKAGNEGERGIPDDEKWHATPRNVGAVTKCLTWSSRQRQRLQQGETFFGSAPPSAVFKNGSLVWVEGEKRFAWTSHSPAHRARYRHEIDFAPGLVPTHTIAALRYSLRGQPGEQISKCVEVLRASLGVALLGCYRLVKRSVWSVGRGGDGKGMFAEILRELIPEYSRSAVQPASLGDRVIGGSAASKLIGSRVNLISDAESSGGSTQKLKNALVCEPLETREMGGNLKTGERPTCGWIVDSNYPLPRVEVDSAWRRRWIVIRFLHSVPEQHRKVEIGLQLARLEYREIVCWAIEGALDLLANDAKFDVPECHYQVMAQWAGNAGTSNVAAFVEDMVSEGRLTVDARGKAVPSLKELFGARPMGAEDPGSGYRAWAAENGYQPREIVNRKTFKAELEAIKGVRVVNRKNQDWVLLDADYVKPDLGELKPSTAPAAERLHHSVDFTTHERLACFAEANAAPRAIILPGAERAPAGRYDGFSDGFQDGIPAEPADDYEHSDEDAPAEPDRLF